MVTFRIFEAMLLVVGIEMRARRFEVRPFALGVFVDMDGVLARRQILRVKLDIDTLLARR